MLKKFIGDKAFYKKVLMLVLPIMLQNGITNLVSMVDNIMVGSVGTAEMSAVAIVNQLLFVFNLAIFGIISGIGIFTAQYFGKNDTKGIKETVRLKLICALIILIAALFIFSFAGTALINSYLHDSNEGIDPKLALSVGKEYLSIMLIGLIPFVIAQVYGGTLREVEKPIIPMVSGIIAVFVNLIFNYLLIFGHLGFPKLGVAGAAIATVISRFVECFVTVFICHIKHNEFTFIKGLYRGFKVPLETVAKVLPKAIPLLMNEFCWSLGIASLNNAYSVRGLDVVAAASITSTISNVFMVSVIAFGSAISIIVGGLLGAGKIKEAKDTNAKMTFMSFVIAVILGCLLIIVAPYFPEIYNTEDSVKQLASSFIICYAVYLPFNALMNAFYFAIRSGGKTVITFIFDSVYMLCVSVPFTFALAHLTDINIVPLYALSLAIEVFKVIIGFNIIIKGKWARNIVNDNS
ncbi:MAG: MATE family efflux transporter [Ruminococcaceae bacterium]|nr:MATE family efflux transporter [Oscillospiraceae bacterium]